MENLWNIMKDNVAYKQPPGADIKSQVFKEIWVTEISQEYFQSLVSCMQHLTQTVIDSKGGHTKYWKVVTLIHLDDITFQIMSYYTFGEIHFGIKAKTNE